MNADSRMITLNDLSEWISVITEENQRYKRALKEISTFGSRDSAAKYLQQIASEALKGDSE